MTVSTGVTSCGRRGSGCGKNKGAAGVDRVTLAEVEDYGVERMLRELAVVTFARACIVRRRRGAWRSRNPMAVSGRWGFPTVRDRVAQQAAKIVLEPIFEADFPAVLVWVPAEAVGDAWRWSACGPGSSRGQVFVVEFDIAQFLRRDRP